MTLVRITAADWEQFRDARLTALADSPTAFRSTYAEWIDVPAQEWQERLSAVPFNLLATSPSGIAGMVSAAPADDDWVELFSMWVAPAQRGTGLAGELIGEVTNWAAAQGKRTYLLVRSDNSRAIAAYRRVGFVEVDMSLDQQAQTPGEIRMEPSP